MAKKSLSFIRQECKQLMVDEYIYGEDEEIKNDEMDRIIAHILRLISRKMPAESYEVQTTVAHSKLIDVRAIEGIRQARYCEYPTGNDPPTYRNLDKIDDMTYRMRTTLDPLDGGSGVLTGTVTFASGSAAITGSGTSFLSELSVGYHIQKSDGDRWYRIYSIESDTALTLADPCLSEDDGADNAGETKYCYETVYVFCYKSHKLTQDVSTLLPQHEDLLIEGVTARAALIRSKYLIDKIVTGGIKTSSEMFSWGSEHWKLFELGLSEQRTRRIKDNFPES